MRNKVNLLIFDGFKVTQWHHCNCILYRLRYLFSYSISCSATTKGNLTREGNQTPSHKDGSTKPQGREKNILHISVRSILVSLLHKDCVFKKRATGENKHLWKTFVRGWWIFSGHIQHKWYTYIMKFFNILIGSGCSHIQFSCITNYLLGCLTGEKSYNQTYFSSISSLVDHCCRCSFSSTLNNCCGSNNMEEN